MHSTVSSLGEHALIARITARLAMPPWVIVGPGDDAAVIEPERGALEVLTTDAQVEGVHFDRRFVPPHAIGYRALAVNLSDLAAMGAQPRAALLSLALPDAMDAGELDAIIDGLLSIAASHRTVVVGGNITRTPGPLMIDVTAIGSVRRRRILTRAGARPGDDVFVTGMLGDAAVGLRSLQSREHLMHSLTGPLTSVTGEDDGSVRTARRAGEEHGDSRLNSEADSHVPLDACEARYLRPEPRVRAGVVVGRNRAASSCMDLSDGLADGVRQVAEASGVGMSIDTVSIPISDASRRWHTANGLDAVETALTGGDDYELLFTVRPAQRGRFRGARQLFRDLPITRIGVVTRQRDLLLKSGSATRELPAGYQHFK